MADCCSSDGPTRPRARQHRCPVNGIEYRSLQAKTVLHHVKQAWQWSDADQAFYFCEDPLCRVVYFTDDDRVLLQSHLRTTVGIKSCADDAPACYCFGVTRNDLRNDPAIEAFIIGQTKRGACSCETSNPSGRCCLGDFRRARGQRNP